MQRVMNLSRIDKCRIQQNLRFNYNDIDILTKVLDDIIIEIKLNCNNVISDGSKALRAVWTCYCENYIKVVVTAHFYSKPIGNEFYITQQNCLFAINNAVKKNNIKFVTTYHPDNNNESLNK